MFWNKRKRLHKKRVSQRVGLEHQHGRVSLFWNTSMAAVFLVYKCAKKKEVAASEPLNDVLTTFWRLLFPFFSKHKERKKKKKKKYLSSWCLTVREFVWNFGFFLVQKKLYGSAYVLFLTFQKLPLNSRQSFAYKFKYMKKQLFFYFSFYR